MSRQLHLNLFLHDTGHHEASWRLPQADALANLDLAYELRLTRLAEAAKFDSVFLADGPGVRGSVAKRPDGASGTDRRADRARRRHQPDRPDRHGVDVVQRALQPGPAPRLARRHLGGPGRLEHRHHRGRRGGAELRAGQPAAAPRALRACGRVPARSRRSSGTPGPTTRWSPTRSAGVHAEPDKVRAIEHRGKYFAVAGPLNVPRTPQAYPRAGAGRVERGRQGLRRALGGGGVHRAADARGGAGVLRRREAPGRRGGPQPGPREDPARHRARDR